MEELVLVTNFFRLIVKGLHEWQQFMIISLNLCVWNMKQIDRYSVIIDLDYFIPTATYFFMIFQVSYASKLDNDKNQRGAFFNH